AFAGGHEPARLDELLASLGAVWEIQQLTFKPYPCGSIAQPYMDCALRVRDRHRVRPDDTSRFFAAPPRGGAATLGAAGREARTPERLCRQVQPAVPPSPCSAWSCWHSPSRRSASSRPCWAGMCWAPGIDVSP